MSMELTKRRSAPLPGRFVIVGELESGKSWRLPQTLTVMGILQRNQICLADHGLQVFFVA